MPDKMYVNVDPIAIKDTFDNKYKSSLQKRITAAFEKAIDRSSKLTTKPPADKTAEGLYLTGTLSLKQTDKGVEAKLSMVLATWPKKSIFATTSSAASTEVANPN